MKEFEAFLDGFYYLTFDIKVEIYNRFAILRKLEKIYKNNEIELEKMFSGYSHAEMFQVFKNSTLNELDKWLFRESRYKCVTLNNEGVQNIIDYHLKEIFEQQWCWSIYLSPTAIRNKAHELNLDKEYIDRDLDEMAIARACFEKDFKDGFS